MIKPPNPWDLNRIYESVIDHLYTTFFIRIAELNPFHFTNFSFHTNLNSKRCKFVTNDSSRSGRDIKRYFNFERASDLTTVTLPRTVSWRFDQCLKTPLIFSRALLKSKPTIKFKFVLNVMPRTLKLSLTQVKLHIYWIRVSFSLQTIQTAFVFSIFTFNPDM